MSVTLNYKSFYDAFRVGVVDNGFTPVAEILFNPLFKALDIRDEKDLQFAVSNQNASKWGNGQIPIPKEIREAAGTDEGLKVIIDNFNNTVIPCVISEALRDELLESVVCLVNGSDLSDAKKSFLISFHQQKHYGEFLGRVFQRALLGNNKIAKSSKKEIGDDAAAAIAEMNSLVRNRMPRPKADVPAEIQPDEMEYVSQLYRAYEETTGEPVDCAEDLSVDYRKHFDFQRTNYYSAECIHREIRDSVRDDEEDCFDFLKDEIETGITIEASPLTHYDNAVERINAITNKAGNVVLSRNTDNFLFGWIGVSQKMGVCHMLVNDARLRWVDEDGEQTV